MANILVISSNFPTKNSPYYGVFVFRTVIEFARLGHQVSVISPQKINNFHLDPFFEEFENVRIYRPLYFSFGSKRILGFSWIRLTHKIFSSSVIRVAKKLREPIDVIYSHFLFPSGYTALKFGEKISIPVFCTLGESGFDHYESDYSIKHISKLLKKFKKIFPNSPDIQNYLYKNYQIYKNVKLVYNGVDTNIFYPRSKAKCREKLSIKEKEKVVIFVGSFINRKGPDRVFKACQQLNFVPKQIYAGTGSIRIQGPQVIHVGLISPEMLPYYLGASDVFVSASLAEGMPNAMLEAMACNIPIVASNISVHKILLADYPCAILCDGNSIDSISIAIDKILTNNVSQHWSKYSFKYTIKNRVSKIINSLESFF